MTPSKNSTKKTGQRLSKYVSLKKEIPRRSAEELIKNGFVKVDGEVVSNPTFFFEGEHEITIGAEVKNQGDSKKSETIDLSDVKIAAFYKPAGYIVTRSDEKSRKTIYDILPNELRDFIYIGRLDLNSEGLLLLTNNGHVSQFLEKPINRFEREYRVRIFGFIDEKKLTRIQKGVVIEGVSYRPKKVELERGETLATTQEPKKQNLWLNIVLETGKNREVRKLMEHFNLQVSKLIRVRYGKIKVGLLKAGDVVFVDKRSVESICKKIIENK